MCEQEILFSRFHRLSDVEVDLSEIKTTANIAQILLRSSILNSMNNEDRDALSHAIYLLQAVGERAIEHFADLCDDIGCGSEYRGNALPLTID